MGTAKPTDTRPKSRPIGVYDALLFLIGAGVFVVVNAFIYLSAHPGFPNPAPQEDVRGAILTTVGVLALIALLRRPGRSFSSGFGAGLLAMTIFVGECTGHWWRPGGDARERAAIRRRLERAAPKAERKRLQAWADSLSRRGMDEAEGTRRAFSAIYCATQHRAKHGEYPRALRGAPHTELCKAFDIYRTDLTGWRVSYFPHGDAAGRVSGFKVRVTPDTLLTVAGPVIEADDQGLVTLRERPGTPAYIRASPLPILVGIVLPCARLNLPAYANTPSATLSDLLFRQRISCDPLLPVLRIGVNDRPAEPGMDDNPNAIRIIVRADGFTRINTTVVYDVLLVPRGAHLTGGFDLHARPNNYGLTGLRSYLLAADGRIHVTAEDRRATVSDPLASACEAKSDMICDWRR